MRKEFFICCTRTQYQPLPNIQMLSDKVRCMTNNEICSLHNRKIFRDLFNRRTKGKRNHLFKFGELGWYILGYIHTRARTRRFISTAEPGGDPHGPTRCVLPPQYSITLVIFILISLSTDPASSPEMLRLSSPFHVGLSFSLFIGQPETLTECFHFLETWTSPLGWSRLSSMW